jgi:hypothetical protein
MFLAGYFLWPCALPVVALLFALAVLGVRDILFAIDLRSSRRAIRGIAFLAAPLVVSCLCFLVEAAALLQTLEDLRWSP